ncbi:MAG TPA: polysaccharide deacetylase family protein [Anaerolineales bacterium]|nr:polysaccharide deacetylase family protein [Anaerolineales bacterium]
MIKQFVPILANSPAFGKFVSLLEHADGERANVLRVLTYHRVDEPDAHPWLDPGLISAPPEIFEKQMKYLAGNYEPVSALDVVNALEKESPVALPPRAVLVTFDDAYCDFAEHAWPVLKQLRVPVILFVPTAFPDHPERLFWWDRLFHALQTTSRRELTTPVGQLLLSTPGERAQAYKTLKNHFKTVPHAQAMAEVERICQDLGVAPQQNIVLGWATLKKLAGEGVTLGAHTQHHPIMNCVTLEELEKEVVGSLRDLTHQIGAAPQTFAYPSGIHNDAAVAVVERAGFRLAFTTRRGLNEIRRADRLRLHRINVGARTTLPVLRAQLLSWSNPVHSLSNRLSG